MIAAGTLIVSPIGQLRRAQALPSAVRPAAQLLVHPAGRSECAGHERPDSTRDRGDIELYSDRAVSVAVDFRLPGEVAILGWYLASPTVSQPGRRLPK